MGSVSFAIDLSRLLSMNRSRSMIRPFYSAAWISSGVGINRPSHDQRTSASKPSTCPVGNSICYWKKTCNSPLEIASGRRYRTTLCPACRAAICSSKMANLVLERFAVASNVNSAALTTNSGPRRRGPTSSTGTHPAETWGKNV